MTVTPRAAASRRRADWRGLAGEVVQFTGAAPFEYRFQGQVHLLTSYERAIRSAGETWIDGRQVSTRHDFGRTLSFIPQGHQLKGSFVPRVLPLSSYFYIDPARLPADPELRFAETDFTPMLFFDDPALWTTTHKLMGLIESPARSVSMPRPSARCWRSSSFASIGVWAWRCRPIAAGLRPGSSGSPATISRPISIGISGWSSLAGLVRLSPTHFCRAFRRSLGMPPHRYHIHRRLEHAKTLLADRERSITAVAMASGFGASSSFATAFRKATGLTPQQYRRSLF